MLPSLLLLVTPAGRAPALDLETYGRKLGTVVERAEDVPDVVARWARKLLRYYERGEIRPHLDRAFPLAEAAEAHRYIESRQSVGKVVLEP